MVFRKQNYRSNKKKFIMYIPKNRIKENLYTPGNEYWIKTTGENYIGFYHSLFNGKFFTGKTLNATNIRELTSEPVKVVDESVPYEDSTNRIALFLDDPDPVVNTDEWNQRDIQLYMSLNGKDGRDDDPREMPQTYYPQPTEDDYKLGVFTRYFAVKINELQYVEVSPKTYKLLKSESSKIVWELYNCFKIQWTISGVEIDVFDTNRDQVLITGKNIKRQGLPEFLKNNYLKFYRSENINDQYTSGDDYTLPNGLNYQGLYHIMPNGIAMTGRFHGEADDILLTPISN